MTTTPAAFERVQGLDRRGSLRGSTARYRKISRPEIRSLILGEMKTYQAGVVGSGDPLAFEQLSEATLIEVGLGCGSKCSMKSPRQRNHQTADPQRHRC